MRSNVRLVVWCVLIAALFASDRRSVSVLHAAQGVELLASMRQGDLAKVEEIVFAVRKPGIDGHWYANFGYYADDDQRITYQDGGRLCKLNLDTGDLTTLLEDPTGAVRDPQVHYDADRIVFSYRPGGTEYYHLYEMNIDGSEMRQLTDGPYDDIEPTYLADDDLLFVSSRCERWVNCWLTKVAVLHRCDANGQNIRAISSNNEHDNTPWPLPNGQILYTRWEYVDRNQVTFHHLWSAAPDGTRQMVYYGNMHPGILMIDAKPIPGSRKVVVSFSPKHGRKEHDGRVTLVDPRRGPDDLGFAMPISKEETYRDPWAFSEESFMAAQKTKLVVMDAQGQTQTIHALSKEEVAEGFECHEPRPIMRRQRERVMASTVDASKETGRVLVADVYNGRNMEGVERGEIKKLLVLETLPKPINFTGGMEPLSYGGTFTLERIMGTVPVEEDGSAYVELPAMRSFFFVALDENDLSVKRMQSFMTLMPGETTTCVGCHEQRNATPAYRPPGDLLAFRRPPSCTEPIADAPEVMDYPRDVQPVLDRHCIECHDCDDPAGGIVLSGDRGPMFSLSYYTMTAKSLVVDGRNDVSNREPRTIGSSASRLLTLMDGSHYGSKPSDHERKLVRLWIDTGSAYPGTYAALGCGMIGGYAQNVLDRSDLEWPSMQASMRVLESRCVSCHKGNTALPLSPTDNVGGQPWIMLTENDPRRTFSRHLLYNLTRPEMSGLLLAPLSKQDGGYGSCGRPVFTSTDDPGYQTVLSAIEETKRKLDEIKRFDMPGFVPRPQYVREMKNYGVLPREFEADASLDVYGLEKEYWRSLWYQSP